jgi:hypothetical protein
MTLHKLILLAYTTEGWKYGAGRLPTEIINRIPLNIATYMYPSKTGKKKAAMFIKQKMIKIYKEEIQKMIEELALLEAVKYDEQTCADITIQTLSNLIKD